MNTTLSSELLSQNYSTSVLPFTIFFLILCFTGSLGNLFVVIMYAVKIKDRDGQRYFIRYLAIADLSGCLVHAVDISISNNMMYTYPNGISCNLLSFLLFFVHCVSTLIIMAITVQRYFMICRPLGMQLDLRRKRICLFLIACLSTFMSLPIFWNDNNEKRTCSLAKEDFDFFFVYQYCAGVFSLVAISITIGLYAMILHTLKLRRIRRTQNEERNFHFRYVCCLKCCKAKSLKTEYLKGKENVDSHLSVENSTSTQIRCADSWINCFSPNRDDHEVKLNNIKLRQAESDIGNQQVFQRNNKTSETDTEERDSTRKEISGFEIKTEKPQSSGNVSKNFTQALKSENIITKMFLAVLTTQILTWFLYIASTFIPRKTPPLESIEDKVEENFILMLRRAVFFGYLLNPVIYLYFDGQFRRKMKGVFCMLSGDQFSDTSTSKTGNSNLR